MEPIGESIGFVRFDDTEVVLWLGIQDLQEFIAWVRGEYSQKSRSIGTIIAFLTKGLSE